MKNNPIITKEAIVELQNALTPVVQKLGQGGEWVYKVYYKQQIVYGIQSILGVLLVILGWFLIGKMLKKAEWDFGTPDNFYAVATIVGSIFLTMATFYVSVSLFGGVGRLINPDYYILQELLSIIKK